MNVPLVALGEVTEIDMGQAPKGESYNEEGEGYPLIAGASDFGNLSPKPSRHTSVPTKISRPGDVILCIRATIGDLNLSDKEYCLGRGVAGLRPKNGAIDSRYLWRVLEASADRLRSKGRGATFLQVSKADIAELEIPLPPLEEQKRIAAILDQADALRRLRTRALDKLNTLGQAIFHEMFGDGSAFPSMPLGEIVKSADKINYGVVQPGEEVDGGVPLLRAGDVLSPKLDPSNFRTISAAVDQRHRKSRLQGDEILIACVGSVGAVSLAHSGLRGVNIARAVARVPVDSNAASRVFVAEQLKTKRIQDYFRREIRLVAQPTLNIKQISTAEIFLPSLEEQNRYSDVVSDTLRSKAKTADGIFLQETLFLALQHRAFHGDL